MTTASMLKEYARRMCVSEAKAYTAYSFLAENLPKPHSEIFRRLAEQERRHYEFWKKIYGGECGEARVSGKVLKLVYMLFGPVFLLKLLERDEEKAARNYNDLLKVVEDEELRESIRRIMAEEEEHEADIEKSINDIRVRYIGFVALGLADAIVEITGVNAGFLGATSNTFMAGLAGLVVGFSASLSMAGAAYLQAKHGEALIKPSIGALVTGLAYMVAVAILVLPYFLSSVMLLSFTLSIIAAVALIASFTYYTSIIEEKPFTREFVESTILMLGTAIATFLFGKLLAEVFGFKGLIG